MSRAGLLTARAGADVEKGGVDGDEVVTGYHSKRREIFIDYDLIASIEGLLKQLQQALKLKVPDGLPAGLREVWDNYNDEAKKIREYLQSKPREELLNKIETELTKVMQSRLVKKIAEVKTSSTERKSRLTHAVVDGLSEPGLGSDSNTEQVKRLAQCLGRMSQLEDDKAVQREVDCYDESVPSYYRSMVRGVADVDLLVRHLSAWVVAEESLLEDLEEYEVDKAQTSIQSTSCLDCNEEAYQNED